MTDRRTSRRGAVIACLLSGLIILGACEGDSAPSDSSAARPKEAAATPEAASPAPAQDAPAEAEAAPSAGPAAPAPQAPAGAASPAPSAAIGKAAPAAAGKATAGKATAPKSAKVSPSPGSASGSAAAPASPQPRRAAPASPAAPAATGSAAGGPAPAAATTGNGGATDAGVTDREIRLGTINMLGMAGGNYLSAVVLRATQAAAASINDRGGIFGRKLSVFDCDDGPGDATRAKACFKKLVEQDKVFAFLMNCTWSSSALHSDFANYQLPQVGAWAYANSEWEDPWMFPVHMSMYHEAHAGAAWARDVIRPKTYGLICLNSPEMQKACQNVREVLDPTGAKMVKKIDVEISTPDMSSEVLGFRAANPDHIIHYTVHPAPVVKFMIDARQQEYYPPKGISGNHLIVEVLGQLFGEWPVNRYWTNSTYNLWGTDYMATMKKYAPANNGINNHVSQASFVAVNFFEEAARRVGANLTREALMRELSAGDVYDAGPGLDQKFSWGPQKNARELGGRTEYMFKLTSTDTSADDYGGSHGFEPDPDRFVIVDEVD